MLGQKVRIFPGQGRGGDKEGEEDKDEEGQRGGGGHSYPVQLLNINICNNM